MNEEACKSFSGKCEEDETLLAAFVHLMGNRCLTRHQSIESVIRYLFSFNDFARDKS